MRVAQRHPAWVVGFADDGWWSRLAHPALHAWTASQPLRLVQHAADQHDPEPKALACDGLWRADPHALLMRFVDGRPIRHVTTQYLEWLAARMAADGKQALVVSWDTASWHTSRAVRTWLKAHNQRVKRAGGCRLLLCQLPSKSPWLNRIEPKWVHGKRAIAEPARKLTGEETRQRICAYYHCELLAPLAQKVA
jgi:DDE superfamily endonuclease